MGHPSVLDYPLRLLQFTPNPQRNVCNKAPQVEGLKDLVLFIYLFIYLYCSEQEMRQTRKHSAQAGTSESNIALTANLNSVTVQSYNPTNLPSSGS